MQSNDLLNAKMQKPAEDFAEEPKAEIAFGAELNDLRQRVVKGEPVTRDELKAALITLRDTFGMKVADSKAKKKPAAKKTKKKMSEEEAQGLLDGLSIPGL